MERSRVEHRQAWVTPERTNERHCQNSWSSTKCTIRFGKRTSCNTQARWFRVGLYQRARLGSFVSHDASFGGDVRGTYRSTPVIAPCSTNKVSVQPLQTPCATVKWRGGHEVPIVRQLLHKYTLMASQCSVLAITARSGFICPSSHHGCPQTWVFFNFRVRRSLWRALS
jgi:hypothetical protein